MPEGHSVHRIALQFAENFQGQVISVSSPQGRFAAGAALLNGKRLEAAGAVGKHMFLYFTDELCMRVHLGIYGAWDFTGVLRVHPRIEVHGMNVSRSSARLGQIGMDSSGGTADVRDAGRLGGATVERNTERSTGVLCGENYSAKNGDGSHCDALAEDSVTSIGAPRKTRYKMAEKESGRVASAVFPPEPVGQVRARLLSETACADLRGPTACEVLDPEGVRAVLARLGPDPANRAGRKEFMRFYERASAKQTAIGQVLMDQSVLAGVGNVYRAELLFRARLDPYTPADRITVGQYEQLWADWCKLLKSGIRVGQMLTIEGLRGKAKLRAMQNLRDRHWVYKRDGLACRICGTHIVLAQMQARKLYWCPNCQSS